MNAIFYKQEQESIWNEIVRDARNATFLFDRNFMDYHRDRFKDCSLLFFNDKNKCMGVFPANYNKEAQRIDSHGGLTYGGLLIPRHTHLTDVKEMLVDMARTYLDLGIQTLRYKPIPHIYHSYLTEDDLYWLFRAEGQLVARSVSTCIDLSCPLPFSSLRKRKVRKAKVINPQIIEGGSDNWKAFWDILDEVLQKQHQTHPVHTLTEIQSLAKSFPNQIKLFTLHANECLAGCVIFECNDTIHVQYIASSETGKTLGALDCLFDFLITQYQNEGKRYFDFGISTENGGMFLNEGLLFQKEGFGGRAICYDTYDIDLKKLALL